MLFLIFLRIAVEKRISKKDCLCSLRQIVPEQVKRRINANDMTRFESGARETENDLRAEIRVAKRRGNGVRNGPGGRLAGKDVGTEYDRLDGQTGMEFFLRAIRPVSRKLAKFAAGWRYGYCKSDD